MYGDVRLERRDLTEFSVAEKKSAMNFHKLIKRVYVVNSVGETTVNR